MRSRFAWLLVGLSACTPVNTTQDSGAPPEPPPASPTPPAAEPTPPPPEPAPPATAAALTVQMTAATLADDCGGPPPAPKAKLKERSASAVKGAKAKRACEQSSMQLSVVAAAGGAATQLAVKKVELFDDGGALIGELTARSPSVWDASGLYQAWDQTVAPGQELSVSYALSQPPWGDVPDRRSRSYVLKAVIGAGASEQAVQRDVQVEAPTILPPGVKT